MGRKKIDKKNKKVNFGITLDPELIKIVDDLCEKIGISKSSFIDKILKEKIKNKNEQN